MPFGPRGPPSGCASACRPSASSVTPGGRVNLRMSVGVHSGAFDFFLVGNSHRELIVTGPGSTRVVEMEGTATAGEIVMSPATIDHLPGTCVGAAKGEGWLLRSAPRGEAPLADVGPS